MIKYGWEPVSVLLDEGLEVLVLQHYEEIAHDQEHVPLNVDWDRKIADEMRGVWRVFTARRDDKLIGYISFYFHESHHNYKTTRYIFDDVFWLSPSERGKGTGKGMIEAAINALPRPSKVQVKVKLTFEGGRVGKIFEAIGFKPVETVYSAYLG